MSSVTPRPLVLDTDIGTDVDDAIALAFCALDPRFDLRAVTTVNGDTQLRARIARAVLSLCGRDDVRVGAGASMPVTGEPGPGMPMALGHEGEGMELSPAIDAQDASSVLVEALAAASPAAPVDIAIVGAPTNVARVLAARPDLLPHVGGLHVMGGCLGPYAYGNPPTEGSPHGEFNFGCDPTAAAQLFALPLPIRLAPVDVTMQLTFTDDDRDDIRSAGPLGATLGALMDRWVDVQRLQFRSSHPAVYLHDPLTVVGIADPSIETTEEVRVAVHGKPSAAFTTRSEHGRPITAIRAVDLPRLRRTLVDAITRMPG